MAEGFAGGAIPETDGFALVGDADGGDVRHANAGHHLFEAGARKVPDFAGIMLHPAVGRIMLGHRAAGAGDDFAFARKGNGAGGGGAGIKHKQDLVYHVAFSMAANAVREGA